MAERKKLLSKNILPFSTDDFKFRRAGKIEKDKSLQLPTYQFIAERFYTIKEDLGQKVSAVWLVYPASLLKVMQNCFHCKQYNTRIKSSSDIIMKKIYLQVF